MEQDLEWKQIVGDMGTSQLLHQLKMNNHVLEETFRLGMELKSKRLPVLELVVELEKIEKVIEICNEKNDYLNDLLEKRRGK